MLNTIKKTTQKQNRFNLLIGMLENQTETAQFGEIIKKMINHTANKLKRLKTALMEKIKNGTR
jgi:hypothetical protein